MIKLTHLLKEVVEENKPKLYALSKGGANTLILLPGSGAGGGQGGSDFTTLANNLGKNFSVYTADFANELDVRKYAKDIANEIESNPNISKFGVGGFSIGGAMAWHLAKELKALDSKKFNNKLFFIDSGIADSTDSFIDNMVAGNKPRVAIAQPLSVFVKNRVGGDLSPTEEQKIKAFYTSNELDGFKKSNEGKYIEYIGSNFPPSDNEIKKQASSIKQSDPWVIEDKFDTTNFEKRYSNKAPAVKGKTFKEGDPIDYKWFATNDTKKKAGLGRELPGGKKLGPLSGVEVISLIASKKKEGAKTPEEIKAEEENAKKATTNSSSKVIPIDALHSTIPQSPQLADEISKNF